MAFLAGLYAPLGSPCILPLYPGFLAFLAGKQGKYLRRFSFVSLGLLVVAGILVSLVAAGLIVTFILQVPLAGFVSVVSSIAFLLLAVFSLLLVLDIDVSRLVGGVSLPRSENPSVDAFIFGLFFGVIILPCNAVAVVALLAIGTTVTGFLVNIGSFLSFGTGMSLPLLVFAGLSESQCSRAITWFSQNRRRINVVAGALMLALSLYYFLFVLFLPGNS